MAPKGKQTSIETRHMIIKLYLEGRSVPNIKDIVEIPRSTIYEILKRYRENDQIANKSRIGQGKKLDEYEERRIVREVKKNPFITANELNHIVKTNMKKEVCAETIRNVMRRHNFNGRIARKKPFISKKNKMSILKFCKELSRSNDFWNTVLFTDESKFNLCGSDGKQYVWRHPNTAFEKQNTRATVKHGGGSVMVWGCVSSAGVGKIHFINGKMDRFQHLDILKQNVKQSAEKSGILDSFAFYQDNDPKHTSQVAKLWLVYNCPKLLQTPAQSPDLNVIEHVWEELARKLYKNKYTQKIIHQIQNDMLPSFSFSRQNDLNKVVITGIHV